MAIIPRGDGSYQRPSTCADECRHLGAADGQAESVIATRDVLATLVSFTCCITRYSYG